MIICKIHRIIILKNNFHSKVTVSIKLNIIHKFKIIKTNKSFITIYNKIIRIKTKTKIKI